MIFVLALGACAGGANSGASMPPGGGTGTTGHGTANATLTITIPRGTGTSSNSRSVESVRPDYISSNTQSMSITINSGTPQDFGLTPTSPGCTGTGSSTTCTITIAAPVGTGETWAFALYSTTNETGTPLSIDTETGISITAGVANNLGPYTLNPVVGSYSVAWNSHSFAADSSSTGSFYLTVKDPSGATIISPGTYETSGGSTVTFSLSDNLPNSAPFNDTSWSYALSFASGSATQPASAAPSNQINVAYGGLSVPATNFYVNDNQSIQGSNATFVSQSAVLGTPALTATCAETADACANGTTSTAATVSFVNGGDTATLKPAEPGWTDSPYSQAFSTSANTCTGGTNGSTLSGSSPTWTLTANTGNNPGSCSTTFKDSATLGQTLTANATYTYTTVIIQSRHRR
ncbi:MAG TPA: hypothetical protein VIN40_08860 [Candidatus Tyrphobacter sp.]